MSNAPLSLTETGRTHHSRPYAQEVNKVQCLERLSAQRLNTIKHLSEGNKDLEEAALALANQVKILKQALWDIATKAHTEGNLLKNASTGAFGVIQGIAEKAVGKTLEQRHREALLATYNIEEPSHE